MKNIIGSALLHLVKIYQYIVSPLLSGHGMGCRYEPTCSHYAEEALCRHGTKKGTVLALKRILRCNPFAGHGYDPVPEKKE